MKKIISCQKYKACLIALLFLIVGSLVPFSSALADKPVAIVNGTPGSMTFEFRGQILLSNDTGNPGYKIPAQATTIHVTLIIPTKSGAPLMYDSSMNTGNYWDRVNPRNWKSPLPLGFYDISFVISNSDLLQAWDNDEDATKTALEDIRWWVYAEKPTGIDYGTGKNLAQRNVLDGNVGVAFGLKNIYDGKKMVALGIGNDNFLNDITNDITVMRVSPMSLWMDKLNGLTPLKPVYPDGKSFDSVKSFWIQNIYDPANHW
jgi:hypothetical protein